MLTIQHHGYRSVISASNAADWSSQALELPSLDKRKLPAGEQSAIPIEHWRIELRQVSLPRPETRLCRVPQGSAAASLFRLPIHIDPSSRGCLLLLNLHAVSWQNPLHRHVHTK